MKDPAEGGPERGTDLSRLEFFSDGVFAIAITLLVLEIRLPEPIAGSEGPSLWSLLLEDLWPDFYSFLISFWFIGFLWTSHHRVFQYMRGYDRNLLLLNLFFLMWIVLLPFSSTLLSRFEDEQLPVIIYALHIAIAELALALVWRYAAGTRRLIDTRGMDARVRTYNDFLVLGVPLVFVLSIGVSFVGVAYAELFWLLAFLVPPFLLKYTYR